MDALLGPVAHRSQAEQNFHDAEAVFDVRETLGGWCRTVVLESVLWVSASGAVSLTDCLGAWRCDGRPVPAGWWLLDDSWCCGRSHGPSCGCGVHAEDGESCEVGGCGEEIEVGIDFGASADAGATAAVAVAHQMAEIAFDFRAGGAVVIAPRRVSLSLTVAGERPAS